MTGRPAVPLLAAALLLAGSLALFWPGIATYDTVAQYAQVLSGEYDDWHPPAMARLWSLLAPLGPGATPMLVVQLASYWLSMGLIAAALARIGSPRRAAAVLAIGIWPVFLGWQGVVLKDAQLVGALLAATGLVAWWRLRAKRLPPLAIVAVVVLLGYALLVRANAAFAVMPLVALLLPLRTSARLGIAIAGILFALVAAAPINHLLLRSEASGVEKTQALYDLAGIAVRTPAGATPFDDRAVAALKARHCVSSFFWDPLGDPAHCEGAVDPLREETAAQLYLALARAVLAHPLAYAEHRVAHVNSTERWLVADRWPSATPPDHGEAATLGPSQPRHGTEAWQTLAGGAARTPPGWPIVWVALGLALIPMLDARPGARLAAALIGSALTLETSFAVVSIASDLRYHLWPMIAIALAAVLAWRRPLPRATVVGGIVVAMVAIAGLAARATLPVPPQAYRQLLD